MVSDWMLCLSTMASHTSDLYGCRRRLRVREPLRIASQCIKADPDQLEHCERFIQGTRKGDFLFSVILYLLRLEHLQRQPWNH